MKNRVELLDDGTARVYFRNKFDQFTIVDQSSLKMMEGITWSLSTYGYAVGRSKCRRLRLHRYLTDCPKSNCVDHGNNNKLDNRLSNLRVTTHQSNMRQRPVVGYTVTRAGKFKATIYDPDSRQVYLGSFATTSEARAAYSKACMDYYGYAAVFKDPTPKRELPSTVNTVGKPRPSFGFRYKPKRPSCFTVFLDLAGEEFRLGSFKNPYAARLVFYQHYLDIKGIPPKLRPISEHRRYGEFQHLIN